MSIRQPIVVAIDGPAASGKSSTAKQVAEQLGFQHVDSGALYRAATAARLRVGGDAPWTEASVLDAVKRTPAEIGEDELRTDAVTRHVSSVAKMPTVRGWVNDRVRDRARDRDIVVDGRDMGTAVFPDARVKVYLIADTWERARRRIRQRENREGTNEDIAAEADRLVHRDQLDAAQSAPAPDAVIIDTTHITQDEQVSRIVALVHAALRD